MESETKKAIEYFISELIDYVNIMILSGLLIYLVANR